MSTVISQYNTETHWESEGIFFNFHYISFIATGSLMLFLSSSLSTGGYIMGTSPDGSAISGIAAEVVW